MAADGSLVLDNLQTYLLNPWALVHFSHNQAAALVTGSFVVAAVGALYTLAGKHQEQARLYLKYGTIAGLLASCWSLFPPATGRRKWWRDTKRSPSPRWKADSRAGRWPD